MISINLLNALDISNDVRHFTGTQYLSDTPSQIGLNYIDVNDGKEYCWWWNIHHLAHKCKEWAFNKDCFVESAYCVKGNFSSSYAIVKSWNRFEVLHKQHSDTEPEAIFKACQWILDNKEKE